MPGHPIGAGKELIESQIYEDDSAINVKTTERKKSDDESSQEDYDYVDPSKPVKRENLPPIPKPLTSPAPFSTSSSSKKASRSILIHIYK